MKRILWLVVISLCLFSLSSFAKPLPIEAFASIPDVRFVSLSPDGKKLRRSYESVLMSLKAKYSLFAIFKPIKIFIHYKLTIINLSFYR
ncbi:hypothetical protein [Shewanella sp. AC91-MNA-CIBAN-0169]|uniref:hypothetical protein n=1 Tax=Shewanella sp. AC91-MNA-CIBAN-0169 TaxID=3140466 RepID=UPI00332523C0